MVWKRKWWLTAVGTVEIVPKNSEGYGRSTMTYAHRQTNKQTDTDGSVLILVTRLGVGKELEFFLAVVDLVFSCSCS